ncbi:uncharacterized protein LOC128235437 [Mya arenaria]|uniref:uncharacterized protein LOC128235437 n=1 Tax=Mya arenaria TaxID=6604 RepID=UPI0022E420DC|nr:uncharacterized protein LOC128235437 [Mya arenaria]
MNFDLDGIFKVSVLADMVWSDKLFNLTISTSVCTDANGTCTEENILENAILQATPCSWTSLSEVEGFDVTQWLEDNGISDELVLSDTYSDTLMSILGMSGFFQTVQCNLQDYGRKNDTWLTDCAIVHGLSKLPSTTACHLDATCSSFTCCVNTTYIQKTFEYQLEIDSCEQKLTLRIERVTVVRSFSEILFDFSLSDWKTEHGINTNVPLDEFAKIELLDELGISMYLKSENCSTLIQNYNLGKWKTEMDMSFNALFDLQPCNLSLKVGFEMMTTEMKIREITGTETVQSLNSVLYMSSKVTERKDELQMEWTVKVCIEDKFDCTRQIRLLENVFIPKPDCWSEPRSETQGFSLQNWLSINNITLEDMFEEHHDKLAVDLGLVNMLSSSMCNITTTMQDISYDFWLLEECISSTTSTGCTSVRLPNVTQDMCLLDDDCRGLTCCAELYFGDITRNVTFFIRTECNGSMLGFGIERKSWQTKIQSKPAYIHRNIKDAILLNITVNNDSPTTIKVFVNLTLCEKISGETSCITLPYLVNQTLNIHCTRKRRKRSVFPVEFSVDDIKLKLKELLGKGSTNDEIQSYIDAVRIAQKTEQLNTLTQEDANDLDSTIKQVMKSLGWNNPETIKHQPVPEKGFTFSNTIEGAEQIVAMLGDAMSVISRANQLYIVGKGLSRLGTEVLGIQLANMTIGDIQSLLHTKKVNPIQIRVIVNDFIDLARVLYSEVMMKMGSESVKNIFESFEFTLKGSFSYPRKQIRFFEEPLYSSISLGGILSLTLEFDAWGFYGLEMGWQAKIISRSAKGTLLPYAGLSTYFEVGIGFILFGKLRLEGQLCNIEFPSAAEIRFSKFPLDVRLNMDLEIRPLKLELFGLVTLEVDLLFIRFKKTLFEKRIWHYEMPKISKPLVDVSTKEEDVSPPIFSPVVSKTSSRTGRAFTDCALRQIPNRDYTEPAFEISVQAADDRSNVKFFVDVGTFQGGNDIRSNMQLGGSETVVKTESQFHYFERLSSGQFVEISTDSFDMRHNTLHFVNLDVTNVLGYRSMIHSQGILTDFSCPEPGSILNGSLDALSFVNCRTLVPFDRPDLSRYCTGQPTVVHNHRTVIDGPGSRTVFNGGNPMTETLYSRSNNYIAANWDGIHDNETGILVYTWFVGRNVCEDSIHPDVDPHKQLLHESHWRNIGIISSASSNKNIFPLTSGQYFVSVRAMNKVNFGGFLGTTICHSIPYIIDITSPIIYEIYDIKYNEDTFLISALHNSTDEESGIVYIDACLGRNPRSCDIMIWSRSTTLTLVQFTFQVPDGIPAWLRLRATNNVDLHVVERANRAILLDASPPIAGVVNDGEIYAEDLQFTKYTDKMCTNWHDFHDPESGISKYEIGVGSKPGMLDVVGLEGVKHDEHLFCFELRENETLIHDNVYYITLWASNAATNRKNVSKSSDGVRVDVTKPLPGNVVDGNFLNFKDKQYSHSKSSVQVQWINFHDPESGIRSYSTSVERSRAGQTYVVKTEHDIDATSKVAAWNNFNLKHLDYIRSTIIAINGALNDNSNSTDGILIDLTEPAIKFIYDGTSLGSDIRFQSSLEELSVNFEVKDEDSGIVELKAQIHIGNQGFTKQFYPGEKDGWIVLKNTETTVFTKNNLQLSLGSKYSFRVEAINGAGLTASLESDGVLIDNTPPEIELLQVGVLGTADEEIVFEYVWQADHDGIKVSWEASDHESGITGFRFAIGTTPGIAVDGPKGGLSNDIDYQGDMHTVTMSFNGFKSSQHGIQTYDWAIGTTPQGEDVQPYLEYAIRHSETEMSDLHGLGSGGQAQVTVDIEPNKTYYTTLRAITNAGNVLQTTTDGFIVDITPPNISILTFGSQSMKSGKSSFQKGETALSGSWSYHDSEFHDANNVENIRHTTFSIGTYPFATDVANSKYLNASVDGTSFINEESILPALKGIPNILSAKVTNKANITAKTYSQSLIQDNTEPNIGIVACHEYIQSHFNVTCEWSGFADVQSKVERFYIFFGFQEGFDDIAPAYELSGDVHSYVTSVLHVRHEDIFYATVIAENSVGLQARAYSAPISVDDTPPVSGVAVELKSASYIDPNDYENTVQSTKMACESPVECNMVDAVCQETTNTIRAAWSPFIDAESGIKSLLIAVGTIPGGGQLKPFFPIHHSAQNIEITGIDLYGKREIFVTIKAENNAGKAASVISNGVYLSYISQEMQPLYHIGVYDSHQHAIGDIDYQVETSSLEAKWDVSGDPCPVIKYEWAIESTDGRVIQNFTDMYTSTHGVNDQLDLKEGERYYSLLRVTNAIGYSYTLRSNGVTVSSDVLIPGEVYDGLIQGYDLSVQQSRTNVSANWDAFGKVKTDLEDQLETGNQGLETEAEEAPDIEYYEVALGTDRRFPKTRDNVVPFTNVGQKTTVTFLNLNLDSGDVVYYFTVKAYSKTYATSFAMSNGFYVMFNGGVNAGEISMPSFVNDTNQLQYSWNGFSSKVDIMLYYIALSNGFANESNCRKYIVRQNSSIAITQLFDVVGVTDLQIDTMVQLNDLDLVQNNSYSAWVLGVDKSGECNMTYHRFHVDITPPSKGKATAGPYYDMDIAYAFANDRLRVQWTDFLDYESGILRFNLTLWTSSHCRHNTLLPIVSLDVLPDFTDHTFYNISLKPETVYFVTVEAVNKAMLRSIAFTSPIIYDNSKPSAGYVAEGADIKEDVVWWGNASSVIGTLLHYPLWMDDECPQQDVFMTDGHWAALDIEHINDPDGIQWGLNYRPANVHIVNKDEIKIKMSRDTKFKQLYSGAYMKSADFLNDGLYQINIKTNNNDGLAVTGVTFWDGEIGDLHLFDHNPVENWSSIDECLCCQAESEVIECPCNCTEYSSNFDSNATSPYYNGTESASSNSTLFDSLIVPADRACGLQIYGGSNPYVVTWCRFYNTSYQPMTVTSDLQFDPAESYHRYSIKFLAKREDSQITQCIKAYADHYELSEMCGIPHLSKMTMIVLHVWNKNSIIPEMNLFNSWTSYSYFKTLKLPPNDSEQCRYAQPWKGGTIPIISYEAGIGTSRTVADVVNFRQVIQPCIPCSGLCSELICHSNCGHDTYTAMAFTIDDIDLSSSTNGSLYIIVKALLGSGEETMSASNGFYIDTTPPTFDLEALFYIDVNQGEFTPAEYQGSSDTIKAVWFCEDDLNEIREYEWAIGSYIGGDDLQRFTSTGVTSIGTNTSFEGILESNSTYYVSVMCTNEAGLVTVLNDTKGVTVLLEAPSEDSINTSAINADAFDEDVYPLTALETSDPTSCGEQWSKSSDDSVDRYDFCVGSSKVTPDDIVPCVWVAVNTSGIVEIKEGHIYIDIVQYFNLSALQAYSEAHYTVNENNNTSEDIFRMEPGRTVFIFMRICNKAQICSFKLTNSVIVKGNDSSLAISKNGTAMSVILGQSSAKNQKRSSVYSIINATFPGGMNDGQSVLLNELSEEELTTIYQSDATPAFRPYIVNPFETLNKTERLLHKRTYQVENSFTISPIGQEELTGAIEITHQQINFDNSDPASNITMLIHWNPDKEEWQISSRSCQDESDTETHYPDLGVTIVKVCNTRTHNSSNDTQQYMYQETQFAVATVRAGPFNSPPYLISPFNISLLEDSEVVTFKLYARDDELDDIAFTQFNTQLQIGNMKLNNSGWLEIELCANCYGHHTLQIELKDTPSFVEVTPAKSIETINVYVVELNDPPTALLYSMEGQYLLKSDPTEPIIFIEEQQIKPTVFDLAIYTAYDVDINESIQLEISESLSTSSGFSVQDSDLPSCIDNVNCYQADVRMKGSGLIQAIYNVTYAINTDTLQDIGIKRLKLAARDSSGSYSDVISIELWIMAMKCMNGGKCLSKYSDQYDCNDEVRTEGFDEYFTCNCPNEWTGQYCEEDVNECANQPCSGREICKNKDGGYECFCESGDFLCTANLEGWSFALIVIGAGLFLFIITIFCFVARWKYRQMKYKIGVYPPNGSEICLQDDFDADIPGSVPPLSTFTKNHKQDDTLQTQISTDFSDDDCDLRHPAPDISQRDIVTVKMSDMRENIDVMGMFPSAGMLRPPKRNVHVNTALLSSAMPPVEGQEETEF